MNSVIMMSNFEIHNIRPVWRKLGKSAQAQTDLLIQVTYKDYESENVSRTTREMRNVG